MQSRSQDRSLRRKAAVSKPVRCSWLAAASSPKRKRADRKDRVGETASKIRTTPGSVVATWLRCPHMRRVRVEREDTLVMFVGAEGDPRIVSGAAQRAFSELESRLGTLRGRRFFGVFNPASSEYLACVQRKDGDDADTLGLQQTVIPGGVYLRATITGQPPALYAQIGPVFDELEKQEPPDPTRPLIEFYRRHNEVDLLVPVV